MCIQCLQYLLAGYYLRRGRQQQQRARKRTRSRKVSTMRLLYSAPSLSPYAKSLPIVPKEKKVSRRCRWLFSIDRRKVLNVNGWEKNKQKKSFIASDTHSPHGFARSFTRIFPSTFHSTARKWKQINHQTTQTEKTREKRDNERNGENEMKTM